MDRNANSDAARKGQTPGPRGKDNPNSYSYVMPGPKGHWIPAYGGGMGRAASEWDPDIGTADEEVGNDADGGRYSGRY